MYNLERTMLEFSELAKQSFYIDCPVHGVKSQATIGGKICTQCSILEREKEEMKLQQQEFIERQTRANIEPGCIYGDSSLENYIPTCDKSVKILEKLKHYDYDSNILMCGNTGNGKTHLSHALINRALRDKKTAYYAYFYDLSNIKIRKEHIFEHILKCDCLVIDEFGINDSDYKSVLLHEIIDKRTRYGKWTIIITNLSTEDFRNNISEQLLSRLKRDVLTLNFCWEDYRISHSINQ